MNSYKHVVLIGVDGAGNFFRKANTPNIDRIFADGSVAYDVSAESPSISAECWGSMLHGVTPKMHQLTNRVVAREPFNPASPFPSVFRVIREMDENCELASFCNWKSINFGIIENGLNVYKESAKDAELTDKIGTYLEEHAPKLLFVQFDEVDGAGHRYGYGTLPYLEQISVCDGYIGRIYEMYEKKALLNETLFIVIADHGGYEKSHGGMTEEEMRVMCAFSGKTVQKGGAAINMRIRDCASVVISALGYQQPECWISRIPKGIFS